jgi:hypothetical protein
MNRAYKLLGILLSYAPNQAAQMKCSVYYNKMRHDNMSEKEIETSLIAILWEGIQFDTWPWNK